MAIYKSDMGSVLGNPKPDKKTLLAAEAASRRTRRNRVKENVETWAEKLAPDLVAAAIADDLNPQQRWRLKNIDHVRARQREYQKAYRERKKNG